MTLLFCLGCGPSAVESKAQALVARRATTNEIVQAYGKNPDHIYTQQQALEFSRKQPDRQWAMISRYPLTYMFKTDDQYIWALICFDKEGRAAGYYLNVQ